MELNTATNAELVPIYNDLLVKIGDDVGLKPLKAWKGKKTELVDKIEWMQEKLPKTKPSRTIRAAALELLCLVEYYEDRDQRPTPDNTVSEDAKGARSVGIPYDEIIRRIKAEFSDAKTTAACLRWYAVKVRVEEFGYEGLRLPQRRPRTKAGSKS